MGDYNTQSFIQSFIRFACEVGYSEYISVNENNENMIQISQNGNYINMLQESRDKYQTYQKVF